MIPHKYNNNYNNTNTRTCAREVLAPVTKLHVVCVCVRAGGVAPGPKVQVKMPEVRVRVREGGVA